MRNIKLSQFITHDTMYIFNQCIMIHDKMLRFNCPPRCISLWPYWLVIQLISLRHARHHRSLIALLRVLSIIFVKLRILIITKERLSVQTFTDYSHHATVMSAGSAGPPHKKLRQSLLSFQKNAGKYTVTVFRASDSLATHGAL